MADTKISALTAIDAVAGGDKFGCADASDLTLSKSATADQIATYIAPAASDTVAGKIEIAVQSEMEAGTDATRAVTPARQHFHPSAAKVWVIWTGNSTTILASYNMTSIADTGVGDADGTIATDFSSANWAGTLTAMETTTGWTAANVSGGGFNAKAAGTFGALFGTIVDGGTAAAALADPETWCVVGFGDQA